MELPGSTRLAEIHMVFSRTNIKHHHEMVIRSSVSIPEPCPGPCRVTTRETSTEPLGPATRKSWEKTEGTKESSAPLLAKCTCNLVNYGLQGLDP